MRKKRLIRAAAYILLIAMGLMLPWFIAYRPPSTQEMIRPPEAEWTGVLSIGVVETWRPGASSFAAYATQIAQLFEKAHPGVLVSVREMEPLTLQNALSMGNAPDVLLFGVGAVEDAGESLMPLSGSFSRIREEYLRSGMQADRLYAVPVAAGGYCVIANGEMLPESAAEDFSWEAYLARMSAKGLTLQCPAPTAGALPAAGLIAATNGAVLSAGNANAPNIAAVNRLFCWPDFVLENKYACYLGTQYDVERLKALKAGGRAFEGTVLPNAASYTDQVQYVALTRPERQTVRDGNPEGRLRTAGALLSAFLSEGVREQLMKLRVMPVDSGEALYEQVAGMDVLERSMAGELYVPNAFTAAAEASAAGSGLAGAQERLYALGWRAVERRIINSSYPS